MAVWALWPMDGAWLCCHLWEHYTYTLDKSQRTVTAERERVIYYFESDEYCYSKSATLRTKCTRVKVCWRLRTEPVHRINSRCMIQQVCYHSCSLRQGSITMGC
ncbi:alpha-L-fucosidase [Trifolium repens]|nr:alpha-L-fucosidase [Trifolium repens]